MHLYLILSKWATLVFVLSLPSALLTLRHQVHSHSFPSEAPNFWFLFVWFCSVDSDRFSLLLGGRIQLSATIKYSLFFFQNISEGHATFIWQRRLLLGQVSTKYSPLIVKLLHKVHQLAVFQEVTLACSLINVTIIKSHQQCYCWCGILYILLLLLWTFLFTFKSCSRSFYTSLRDLNTSSVTKNEWCSSYFDCVQKVSCTNLQRLFVQSTHCSFRSDRLSLFCQSWDFSAMQKKYFSTGERRHFRNIFGIKQLNYSGEREKQHCRSWLIEEISSYGFKHLGCRLCI